VRILLGGVVVLLLLFGVGCGGESPEKDTAVETPQGTTQEKAVTVEETTAPRETTEVTTGFEFSVGRTPMDEEEDDDEARRREIVVEREGRASSDAQEEQYPPVSDSSTIECRFFSQSEWVQADPEQKAFIQECDRAAGRAAPSASPSENESDARDSSQERATQPEPQSPPSNPPAPAATGGGAAALAGGTCPNEAPIKGNASSGIYHVPSGQFYDRTNAEECFASESAAQDAGYRASQR